MRPGERDGVRAPDGAGRIVTFYSYKGGTGRTMALANVAWILASNGRRVLTIDWDLESPGLHRFYHPFLDDKTLSTSDGVIDLLRAFAEQARKGVRSQDGIAEHARVLAYAVSLDWDFPDGGGIDLLPAGRQGPAYSGTVSTFNWPSFYDRLGGAAFLRELRRDMREHYDFVLIDSRTGLSDSAGICTVLLPDAVVDCFTLGAQSIDGAVAVANSIRSLRADEPVEILPIPMRVEDAEQTKLEAGRDYARLRFQDLLGGLPPDAVDAYWGELEIPYKPYYAYEEILAVFGDRPRHEGTLLAAYERLTRAISGGAVTELVPLGEPTRRSLLGKFERFRPTAITRLLVSYAPTGRMWAEWITATLADAGLPVVMRNIDSATEAGFVEHLRAAGADRAVMVMSSDYPGPDRTGSWWAVDSDASMIGRLVLPVVLADGTVPAPFDARDALRLSASSPTSAREALLAGLHWPVRSTMGRSPHGTAPGPRFPDVLPQVWNVPARNASFTGRGPVLEQLRDRLSGRSGQVTAQALSGLGGVGKTQIAIEYAHRFAADYDIVWWVPSAQPSMARAAIADLAVRLDLSASDATGGRVQAALDALRRGDPYRRWLLVFDNAGDHGELRELIPEGSGHVVVTTRTEDWAQDADVLEVPVFSREESVRLLHRRLPALGREDAELLAGRLGDLPLAMEQAGAWFTATGMPVARYLDLLAAQLPRMLAENPPAGYDRAVAATWLLSLDRLRSQAPAAAKLAELCAFFGPEPIPVALLYGHRSVNVLLPYDPGLHDPILHGQLVREIGRHGLIRVDFGKASVEMHRLVQEVIRDSLDAADAERNRRDVHDILAEANPRNPDDRRSWEVYEQLWPHVVPSEATRSSSPEVRQLIVDIVRYLWRRGDYAGSQELTEATLLGWRAMLPVDDGLSWVLQLNLANAMRSQARYDSARQIDEQANSHLTASFGPDHPYTIMSLASVGADLLELGEYERARSVNAEVLTRSQEVLGEDHPRTLMAANNVAVALRLVGDPAAAARLDEDTFARRRRVLGERDLGTWLSAVNHGRDLREIGDFRGSHERLRAAFQQLCESVGPDHPQTLRAAANLAVTLRRLGEFAGAQQLVEDTLARYERLHGWPHPDTLACASSQACVRSALGDDLGARTVAQSAYDRFRSTLGGHHLFSLASASNLAVFARRLGDHPFATRLGEQVTAGLGAAVGTSHPYLLASEANLATCRFEAGEYAEAQEIDERVYAVMRDWFGADHPDVLIVGGNLVASRRAVGASSSAEALLVDVLTRAGRVLGDGHPDTVALHAGLRLDCYIDPPAP
jgi:cellulose biosynthesis protein BcsQ/tetratricopeptide (TPR) repeat protein